MPRPEKHVFVCSHLRPPNHEKGSCKGRGAKLVIGKFAEEFEARGLHGRFRFSTTDCLGVCEHGPAAVVYPEGIMYGNLTADDVPKIIETHLLGGEAIEDLKVPAEAWE
jgi:(2Fe-2S) ferredoxin